MAENSDLNDLNAGSVLFDRENEVLGLNSSTRSNVNVNVGVSEALIGDVEGTDGSIDLLSGSDVAGFHMNSECDVMVNGCEKEGFCQEKVNGLEDGGMFGVVDGRCDGKVGKFSCGSVKNEDEKNVIQCSGKDLVFGFNNGVQIEQESENVGNVSLSDDVQGAEDDDGTQRECGVENMDVNAQESVDTKVSVSRKAFLSDAQVNVIQDYIMGISNSGEANSENNQYDCCGLDLVVDLNSYKNTQEDNVLSDSVFSDVDVNYHVSDLVWGKVRGHPWWPGQIYDPSVASEMAKRHRKENCYLIAYFGDQTFAWNDVSKIKPFHKHFAEFEKQSDMEIFRHAVDCAVDEVSRRVEFGLYCPCKPEEVFSKLKIQEFDNGKTLDQSSRRNGGDRFIGATSFDPAECVGIVKSLAQSPLTEFDRLDFASTRAQVSAFYRSKGYSQLPEFAVLGRLFENDMETLPLQEKEQCDQMNEQVLKPDQGFLQNSKSTSWRGRKPKAAYNTSDYCFQNFEIVGTGSTSQRGRKRKLLACNSSDCCFNNSQNENHTQLQNVSIEDMWSQLCLAAKDSAGESCYSDVINYFAEFGKFTGRNNFAFFEEGTSLEQVRDGGETGVITSEEAAATASMSTPMEFCNDSYWTDRIIQSTSEEETLIKQNEREKLLPAAEVSSNSDLMHQDSDVNLGSEPSNNVELDNVELDTDVNLISEPSNNVKHVNESSPTSLTLRFTNFESVPSIADLNKIFSRYGPLIESKTVLLEKTNCARVVFKRRSDAESAFSSAGKYSIFGPSLKSYRLKILPPTPEKITGKRGRKSKKEKSSMDTAAEA